MIRWLQILSIAIVAMSALVVFQLKYRAEAVSERVAVLRQKVDREQEAITLLRAEWSFLVQPSRLQALVERHQERLQLQPVSPEQIIHLDSVPARPIGILSADRSPLAPARGNDGARP